MRISSQSNSSFNYVIIEHFSVTYTDPSLVTVSDGHLWNCFSFLFNIILHYRIVNLSKANIDKVDMK
jgi:hypothetical protein